MMTELTPRDLFRAQQLPFPTLPPALEARLTAASPHMFSTHPLEMGLYQLDHFVEKALAGAYEDFAAIGFDGYGVNSWALHVYVVEGPRAVLLQLPWGGAYLDPDESRAEILETYAWVDRVAARLVAASGREALPGDQRLFIVDSEFGSSGWNWIARRGRSQAALRMTRLDRSAVERALDALETGALSK
jgi:hypothetical protein